jgi:hypothetical protein
MLAAERLACVKDAVIEGTISWRELPEDFDPFVPGFSLAISASGSTTPLDDYDHPVRSCAIRWHEPGEAPMLRSTSMRFSNLKRPFEGDSLYTHPAPNPGGPWLDQNGVFAAMPVGQEFYDQAGNVVGYEGSLDEGQYNALATGRAGGNPVPDDLSGGGGVPDFGGPGADFGGFDAGSPSGETGGRSPRVAPRDRFFGAADNARAMEQQRKADGERAAADRARAADRQERLDNRLPPPDDSPFGGAG